MSWLRAGASHHVVACRAGETDARDALHLARPLRLNDIVSVAVPTVAQEAARDLVRAREDCRGDLTRARHRLSKVLLRHGIVYEFSPLVRRLGCLRGISTLTRFALAVEIGDWTRFTGATIGSFVGLTPAEYSSGSSRTLGPITKTGNSPVRRLLAEAARQTMRDRG